MKTFITADGTSYDVSITSTISALQFPVSSYKDIDAILEKLTETNLKTGSLDGVSFRDLIPVTDSIHADRTSSGVILTVPLRATGEDKAVSAITEGVKGGDVAESFKPLVELAAKGRDALSDTDALTYSAYFPEWDGEGKTYTAGERVQYGGKLYKILQAHTSQSDWKPTAAASLFSEILAGQSGTAVGEWKQPDSTNPYSKGDKVIHNGYYWTSLVDNNVWEPTDSLATLWEKGEAVAA
jgi:hypothetical protein